MSTPLLFQPFTLRDLTVRNRAWVAPMCMYAVEREDGVPTDFHLVHLGAFAQGGFGLVLTEATAVRPEGRISPQDTGLWNDQEVDAWRRVTDFAHTQGAAIGVQLAHAGRKASTYRGFPGEQQGPVAPSAGGWPTVGPSPEAFPGLAEPTALDAEGLRQVVHGFRDAAERAGRAGFDVIEVHAAHGYLLHQFLSPLSNQRDDTYGGSLENRCRLVLEVVDAIREVWAGPLFVRISATDWTEGGWDLQQSIQLSSRLREHGVDLVDVSSGGNVLAPIAVAPNYQVPFAAAIHREAGVPTAAVGLITEAEQAERILVTGDADAVLLGREALRDPHWPIRAAHQLGLDAAASPLEPVARAWCLAMTALTDDLRGTLEAYQAPDPDQELLRAEFLDHLARHPDAVHRDGPPAHFTASVLVVDAVGANLTRVLLTHHRRARMWLQFGGHLEPTDHTVRGAALREGLEESGLGALQMLPRLVELDRHELHGDFVRCTHHLDLRFVAVAPADARHATSDESLDVAWWPASRLPSPAGEDLPRLVERVRRLG